MCAPGCMEHVTATLSRRSLFEGAAAAAVAGTAAAWSTTEASAQAFPQFSRVVDLTHPFSPEFPTFFGTPGIALKRLKELKADGFNMYEWTLLEHAGTHMDAPIHFSADGATVDALPASQLVVPLAVVDVREKAEANPDYQLTPADFAAVRWGLECVAGLDQVPARGATLVVGAPKVRGATGGPTRLLALV